MWTIKHIFNGEYGCEEREEEAEAKLSVTLVNEDGEEKMVSVTDTWLYRCESL